jgi:hypothetical protein
MQVRPENIEWCKFINDIGDSGGDLDPSFWKPLFYPAELRDRCAAI